MTIQEIKKALSHQPYVKKVWVKESHEGVFWTSPIVGGKEIDLTKPEAEVSLDDITTEEVTKPKKDKANGTK